jgi:hypothetical protein
MGIDRIGKGAPPAASPSHDAPVTTDRKEATFSFDRPARTDATTASGRIDPSSQALAKLRAGEVDVDGYVDLRVAEATRGLSGLSASELDDLRSMLRDHVVTDPALAELVQLATGTVPRLPEE